MSEQENKNNIQCSDGSVRKQWMRPVFVDLSEADGKGAEGRKNVSIAEFTTAASSRYGPS